MRTAAALTGLVLLLLPAGCGGGSHPDAVSAYVERVNAVQAQAAPVVSAANDTFGKFASGKLKGTQGELRLREAELGIESIRQRLAALTPPPRARRLGTLVQRVYALNVLMAAETRQLAAYVPRAERAIRTLEDQRVRLARTLRATQDPTVQVTALHAYVRAITSARAQLGALQPPPVLVSDRRAQMQRLGRARAVAARLADAIARRDAAAVTGLIARFQASGGADPTAAGLRAGAIAAYRQRLAQIDQAGSAAQTEVARLSRQQG